MRQLVQRITDWTPDPTEPGRQVAWVTEPGDEYDQSVYRFAVRTPKRDGQWGYGVIVSTLAPEVVAHLVGFTP